MQVQPYLRAVIRWKNSVIFKQNSLLLLLLLCILFMLLSIILFPVRFLRLHVPHPVLLGGEAAPPDRYHLQLQQRPASHTSRETRGTTDPSGSSSSPSSCTASTSCSSTWPGSSSPFRRPKSPMRAQEWRISCTDQPFCSTSSSYHSD